MSQQNWLELIHARATAAVLAVPYRSPEWVLLRNRCPELQQRMDELALALQDYAVAHDTPPPTTREHRNIVIRPEV